jgi:hypothetical protein
MYLTLALWEDIVHVTKLLIIFFVILNNNTTKYYHINLKYSSVLGSFNNKDENKIDEDKIENLEAVKTYQNFEEDRVNIIKEGNNMSGVYFLMNNINGHTYVGSSINLATRMRNYLNTSFLKSKQNINMPIVKALLKYGHSNFSL